MRFSERYGHKEPAPFLQPDELTNGLRNRIWNALYETYFGDIGDNDPVFGFPRYSSSFNSLSTYLRHFYFKIPIDDRNNDPEIELEKIRKNYHGLNFPEFYDFLETMAGPTVVSFYQYQSGFRENKFTEHCNHIFEEEKAAFRFVENLITPTTNKEERAAINDAAKSDEAGCHIVHAVTLYRDRSNPDYRNSVKESISAVEATYRQLTGKRHKNINTAIAELEGCIDLPTSLKNGFSSIYGWTSGPDGIRHALMKNARDVTEPEARLMLVMCSAYVNYLLSLRGSKPK